MKRAILVVVMGTNILFASRRMMMRKTAFLFVVLLLWVSSPGACATIELIAYSYDDNSLYSLPLDTLQPTKIGTMEISGDSDLWALAHAGPGAAYTVDRATDTLYTVDITDASTIASVQLDQDMQISNRGLDVSPAGVLYGVFPGTNLRTIDPKTGASTLLFNIEGVVRIESIAFSPDGRLYAVGDVGSRTDLYEVDLVLQSASLISRMNVSDIDCLTYAPDGFLYGADSILGAADLYKIDPLTGQLFNLGTTGIIELNGLLAVPEPVTLLLLGFGGMALLRRKRGYGV